MVSRRALIIGAPDDKIPGVKIDINNINSYLKSAIGGLWANGEIINLTSPSEAEVKKEIALLKTKDYSFVFFAGHGYHSSPRNSTIIHLNSRETLDSAVLRCGAPKHTLILDCCRKLENDRHLLKAAMESFALDSTSGQRIDPQECRRYYDKEILECDNGLVVMNSCSINETSGESGSNGGYYTSSLIDSAREWVKHTLTTVDLSKNYAKLTTQACHDIAVPTVRALSGNRQNPSFESPRAEKKFPFSVVA